MVSHGRQTAVAAEIACVEITSSNNKFQSEYGI